MDKANKEYFLREQVKVIQEELGEDEEKNEIENYKEKLAQFVNYHLTFNDSLNLNIKFNIIIFALNI